MRNKFRILSFVGVLLGFQYGCHAESFGGKSITCDTKPDITAIAADYIKNKLPPAIEDLKFPAVVKDMNDQWEVYYELPTGVAGGTAHIFIDKKKCSVLKAELYQ